MPCHAMPRQCMPLTLLIPKDLEMISEDQDCETFYATDNFKLSGRFVIVPVVSREERHFDEEVFPWSLCPGVSRGPRLLTRDDV